MQSTFEPSIEAQIREWRAYLLRRRTIHQVDVEELEDHLRSEMSELVTAGLSGDESFLAAIKRLGGVSRLGRDCRPRVPAALRLRIIPGRSL